MTNLTQDRFELEDVNGQPVVFSGWELGHVSSRREHSQRWMELRILKTVGGQYVLEITGQTLIEGEVIKNRARILPTADALIDALHNRDDAGTKYLTYTAREALDDAMEHDPDLAKAWAGRVQEVA